MVFELVKFYGYNYIMYMKIYITQALSTNLQDVYLSKHCSIIPAFSFIATQCIMTIYKITMVILLTHPMKSCLLSVHHYSQISWMWWNAKATHIVMLDKMLWYVCLKNLPLVVQYLTIENIFSRSGGYLIDYI